MCGIGGELNKHQDLMAKSIWRYLTALDYSQLSRLQLYSDFQYEEQSSLDVRPLHCPLRKKLVCKKDV